MGYIGIRVEIETGPGIIWISLGKPRCMPRYEASMESLIAYDKLQG